MEELKTIVIPDVHGRTFWRKILEIENPEDYIFVFLGDYLDPYPEEGITKGDAFIQFMNILDFKKKYPDNVILLIGNHCYHYINLASERGSRFDRKNMSMYHGIFNENKKLFQLTYTDNIYLYSHAGICDEWLNRAKIELPEDIKEASDYLNKLFIEDEVFNVNLQEVSYYRGGYYNGSIIWRDAREPISNKFKQVFGHTALHKPYITNDWACLDCQKVFIVEKGEIKEYE